MVPLFSIDLGNFFEICILCETKWDILRLINIESLFRKIKNTDIGVLGAR